jgi:phage tail P2-like protein
MRLKDCKTEKLLPLFMRKEKDDVAIARTIDPTIRSMGEKVEWLSDWGFIDELPEEWIDALAWELDVDWYAPKSDRSLEVRRELVKNADEVHKHLGTRAAVESVAKDIFGDGHVEEWFEYSGDPGTFKVWISTQLTNDTVGRFMKTIGQVKNARSHLIEVTCRITQDVDGPDIEYHDIPPSYGETDIYNDFRFFTLLYESEDISTTLTVEMEFNSPEQIDGETIVGLSIESTEDIRAAMSRRSDPCYLYNGVYIYDGTILYDSYMEEEVL